jgi:hypothetical protein
MNGLTADSLIVARQVRSRLERLDGYIPSFTRDRSVVLARHWLIEPDSVDGQHEFEQSRQKVALGSEVYWIELASNGGK